MKIENVEGARQQTGKVGSKLAGTVANVASPATDASTAGVTTQLADKVKLGGWGSEVVNSALKGVGPAASVARQAGRWNFGCFSCIGKGITVGRAVGQRASQHTT